MLAVIEPVTVACAASFVFFSVYLIALWIYGLRRTGSSAFFLLLAAAVIGLGVSLTNLALVCDSYIGIRLLGRDAWKIFYYAFVCIQPIQALLGAVGLTILALRTTNRSNQALQPTAGRRTEGLKEEL